MLQLKDLSDNDWLEIHKQYRIFQSLNQTAEWVQEIYGVVCTRHHLSPVFKRKGLYVQPPNGRDFTTIQETDFVDGTSKFAGRMIDDTWADIRAYINNKGSFLDYISACWFVSSPAYTMYLDALNSGLREMRPIGAEVLAPGVNPEHIIEGRAQYQREFDYWVLNGDW